MHTPTKMSGEMFDGKDYPVEWAMNSSTYQNMSNDQGNYCALMMRQLSTNKEYFLTEA